MIPKLIIFTDLDGSLLDHFTYSFEPAVPLLEELDRLHVPVVFTTSKTSSEVVHLRNKIGNQHPFIVENGAGICIPKRYFKTTIAGAQATEEYFVKSFTPPHSHWSSLLEQVNYKFLGSFKAFTQLTEKELVELTGLSVAEARRAQQREFGEPLSWHGEDSLKQDFVKELERLGAHVLQGGRFVHVSGDCDKGRALTWLLGQYSAEYQQECVSIAAGDSGNDVAMLEAANISLIVRSPVHPPPTLATASQVFTSTLYGPEGWVWGIKQILSQYNIKL